jgi:hypothetical protein
LAVFSNFFEKIRKIRMNNEAKDQSKALFFEEHVAAVKEF